MHVCLEFMQFVKDIRYSTDIDTAMVYVRRRQRPPLVAIYYGLMMMMLTDFTLHLPYSD